MVPSLHILWNVAHTLECNTMLQQCNHLICHLCGTRYVTGYLLKWHRTMEHNQTYYNTIVCEILTQHQVQAAEARHAARGVEGAGRP